MPNFLKLFGSMCIPNIPNGIHMYLFFSIGCPILRFQSGRSPKHLAIGYDKNENRLRKLEFPFVSLKHASVDPSVHCSVYFHLVRNYENISNRECTVAASI